MGKLDERHTRPSVVSGQRVAGGDAVSGVVHVIRDESEVDRFREGEILVASEIPESWSHLFSLAKAIITEKRDLPDYVSEAVQELSLPVIAGVQNATSDLRSGDIVMMHIDGTIQRLQDRREPDSKMRVSVPAAVRARQFAHETGDGETENGGASVIRFSPPERSDPVQQDAQLDDDEPRKMC